MSGTPHPGNSAAPSGPFVIAIDGPAGTGKSTVARRVAQALKAGYLDTGAMYRIVTLAVLDAGIDPHDGDAVAHLSSQLNFDTPINPGIQHHRLSQRDVSAEIRGAAVTLAVTPVSANPAVRAFLLDRQRELAHSGRMVVEGRDIGTVVVPEATLKIYLTADAGERARRRHQQNTGMKARPNGGSAASGSTQTVDHTNDLAAVARDLQRRDTKDSTRAHAPLQAAADAVVVDSSTLELDETVAMILGLVKERGVR